MTMKIYQCIHKYPPHISLFEKKYGVTDDMDFETLKRLVISDGYASAYILAPALEGSTEEVFYTLWDYDRLQHLWAKEHGLKTRNLDEIKLAQIEEFNPDVFYNMSAFCDGDFVRKLRGGRCKNVYWNGIIESTPRTYPEYDGQLSLHRPYVKYWQAMGLAACELQPGIPSSWLRANRVDRNVDALFYGQYEGAMFATRNRLVEQLLHYKSRTDRDIRCHLQCTCRRLTIFKVPGLPWTRVRLPQFMVEKRVVAKYALPPLYGESLYDAIESTKIVINAYTDNNIDFKSNMRLFEAIGLGAFLISEAGQYPDGFEPGVDFYTYKSPDELFTQIEKVLSDWPLHAEMARVTQRKITALYSKERQWCDFKNFVATL